MEAPFYEISVPKSQVIYISTILEPYSWFHAKSFKSTVPRIWEMSVIAIEVNFNFEYLQFVLELGAQQGVQNDRDHHIISGE